jgi:hypothetical protein
MPSGRLHETAHFQVLVVFIKSRCRTRVIAIDAAGAVALVWNVASDHHRPHGIRRDAAHVQLLIAGAAAGVWRAESAGALIIVARPDVTAEVLRRVRVSSVQPDVGEPVVVVAVKASDRAREELDIGVIPVEGTVLVIDDLVSSVVVFDALRAVENQVAQDAPVRFGSHEPANAEQGQSGK